jgi:hypothetical protein
MLTRILSLLCIRPGEEIAQEADQYCQCNLKVSPNAYKYIIIFKYRPRFILKRLVEPHTKGSSELHQEEGSDDDVVLDERRTARVAGIKRQREEREERRRQSGVSSE